MKSDEGSARGENERGLPKSLIQIILSA